MKLQQLNEDLTTRIQHLLNKYYRGDSTKLELLQTLSQLDPTPNHQYLEWIVKHHKSGAIRIPEDNEKIREQLQQFHVLKNKQAFKTKHSPDINKYTPSTLYNVLADYEGQGKESNRQAKHKTWYGELTLPPGSELILDDGEYQVVKITDVRASEILCTNTNWCTANLGPARDYLYGTDEGPGGPLYLVYVDGKRSYLVHYESDQFKHPDDSEVDGRTKLELIELLSPVTGVDQYSSPGLAYWWYTNINNDDNDSKRLSEVIKKSARWAYEYVWRVLGGKLWPEAEPYIMKSPRWAYYYAYNVMHGPWPEAEPYILKDRQWACYYARDILRGRWPEAEPHIMKNPHTAYYYARNVLKRPWPEAEIYIMKDPHTAYYYVINVLKRRWPEAEIYIRKDEEIWQEYTNFIKSLVTI